jgi:mannitol-1-/sugar-/sorbitol-6-phosphatase
MDGTLVDSHASVERAWSAWAKERGLDADAVLAIAHGSWAARTVRRLLPGLDEDLMGASAHLDHLVRLGVDVVWLTPFFRSPMRDHLLLAEG